MRARLIYLVKRLSTAVADRRGAMDHDQLARLDGTLRVLQQDYSSPSISLVDGNDPDVILRSLRQGASESFTGSGFLPTEYQGTAISCENPDPEKMIRYLRNKLGRTPDLSPTHPRDLVSGRIGRISRSRLDHPLSVPQWSPITP